MAKATVVDEAPVEDVVTEAPAVEVEAPVFTDTEKNEALMSYAALQTPINTLRAEVAVLAAEVEQKLAAKRTELSEQEKVADKLITVIGVDIWGLGSKVTKSKGTRGPRGKSDPRRADAVRKAMTGLKTKEIVAATNATLSGTDAEPVDANYVTGVIVQLKSGKSPHGTITMTGEARSYQYTFVPKPSES